MPKLQMTKGNQFFLTVPVGVVQALNANKGDNIEFNIDLKKGSIQLKKQE